jgi:hypothetical protein
VYSLVDAAALDGGTLSAVSSTGGEPVVEEVLRVEDLSFVSTGSRRAIVRWSDGTESAALTFYADEPVFCEGDLVGKTQSQIRSLHFRRDRDWLQS